MGLTGSEPELDKLDPVGLAAGDCYLPAGNRLPLENGGDGATFHAVHLEPERSISDAAGLLYYVMPHVGGESLRDRLKRDTQLPIPDETP